MYKPCCCHDMRRCKCCTDYRACRGALHRQSDAARILALLFAVFTFTIRFHRAPAWAACIHAQGIHFTMPCTQAQHMFE